MCWASTSRSAMRRRIGLITTNSSSRCGAAAGSGRLGSRFFRRERGRAAARTERWTGDATRLWDAGVRLLRGFRRCCVRRGAWPKRGAGRLPSARGRRGRCLGRCRAARPCLRHQSLGGGHDRVAGGLGGGSWLCGDGACGAVACCAVVCCVACTEPTVVWPPRFLTETVVPPGDLLAVAGCDRPRRRS